MNHIIDLINDPSPYGEAYPQILYVIARRLPAGTAKIADIAGGYGRYAIPLAAAGHDVTIVDIDPPHLTAAQRNAADPPDTVGRVTTLLEDVTRDEDLQGMPDGAYDASLNLAFLYLAHPETAKSIFRRCARLHRPGGLALSNTPPTWCGRIPTARSSKAMTSTSTAKPKDGRFSPTCSATRVSMTFEIGSFTIHEEQPLYWHADVLVGIGIKKH